MYGLNAVAFVFFISINLFAYQLCKYSEASRKRVLSALCVTLLFNNIIRYAVVYPLIGGAMRIPVEFSTVAYFAVPMILLTARKNARSWAAYSGLMAGFFYYIAMVAAGGPLYNTYPPHNIYLSMFCHGTLYICGFITVGTEAYNAKDVPKLVFGVVLVAVRAILLRPIVKGSERLLIYILLDGVCVKQLLPQNTWNVAMPIYYVAVASLVFVTIKGFFKINRKQYRKFSMPCVAPE